MPVNMTLVALLMSGAVQPGEPVTKLTLGVDVVSQPNGGAGIVLVRCCPHKPRKKKIKGVAP